MACQTKEALLAAKLVGGRTSPTVVLVCMVDSIHSARWLSQFSNQDIQFHIFGSGPNRRVHPELRALLRSAGSANYKLHWSSHFGAPLWVIDRIFRTRLRAMLLSRLIHLAMPNLVHAMELQAAGYLILDLPKPLQGRPKLMITNWGSDIFWFQRFPKHEYRIRKLLKAADFYSAECERDVVLARQLGFAGMALPVMPNAGGLDLAKVPSMQDSEIKRNLVAVKGYEGWVGRARIALEALGHLSSELDGLTIVVLSANLRTVRVAKRIAKKTRLRIVVHPKNTLSHEQVRRILERSVIYLGVSESDGISTTMLEAMGAGAIPVQTSTACCDEWFTNTGVAITEISIDSVSQAVIKGLRMAKDKNNLVTNFETIRDRASSEVVSEKVTQSYLGVLRSCL